MSGKVRRRVLKRLTRVRKGLVVHVLVEDRKQNEIGQLFSRIALAQAFQQAVARRSEIRQRLFARRQRQVPADIVRDRGGIIKRIRIGKHRGELSPVAQRPPLLEPGHVSDFPAQRVDDREAGAHELLVRQVGDQAESPLARLPHHLHQLRPFVSFLDVRDGHRFADSRKSVSESRRTAQPPMSCSCLEFSL